MSVSKGDRVGVMWGANPDTNTIEYLGMGTFEGEEIPPEDISPHLFRAKHPTVKIKLDTGDIVWGFESWWSAADSFNNSLKLWETKGWTIAEVKLADMRARNHRSAGITGTREHQEVPPT